MLRPLQFIFNAACSILPCRDLPLSLQNVVGPAPHRVAIIGAGAAGSSAAFWIAKGNERVQSNIAVDIYEKENYVGGRSTVVYPHDSRDYLPIELGASIFVQANKNLMRASKEFNLTLEPFDNDDGFVGVWDGQQFLVKLGSTSWIGGWWNKVQILWRYGYQAPSRTLQLVRDMIASYNQLYSVHTPHWQNISEACFSLNFVPHLAQTMTEYLDSHKIDRRWTREMVEAATRVNYGQNADTIHALSGMVSMAATGATSVKGGNYQIFEHFIAASGARLFLNTTVLRLQRTSSSWQVETASGIKSYDSVILAAPYSPNLKIEPSSAIPIDHIEYVPLHVTLLSTTSQTPNATYFAQDSNMPTTILTSFEGVRSGGKEPAFNSISYHGPAKEGSNEWIVKIFSQKRLSIKWLSKVFNGQVDWVHRKQWDAYPVMKPRSDFPAVRLSDGLYYVNAFEPFMSTMETETVASRNVVDILFQQLFNMTICGSQRSQTPKDGFVYGWDC